MMHFQCMCYTSNALVMQKECSVCKFDVHLMHFAGESAYVHFMRSVYAVYMQSIYMACVRNDDVLLTSYLP